MKCEERYKELYQKMPEEILFCPYRINPLGAHVDHQLGKINGLALDKGIHIAYGTNPEGIIEVTSVDFPSTARFKTNSITTELAGDWADTLRGAAKLFAERAELHVGINCVLEGSLPIGGLASSTSVIIAFLLALSEANRMYLSPREMILLTTAVKNKYLGLQCGKLDPCCEVLSRKDQLLYLDTKDDRYSLIPMQPGMPHFKIALIYSGLDTRLAKPRYNVRVDECRAAAYSVLAHAGRKYDTLADANLRDLPRDLFDEYKDRLPENWVKRAEHFYAENYRAELGAAAWEQGDIDTYGGLIFESGYSSVHLYEAGSDELKYLYEILTCTRGVYGGRFSGSGFRGYLMALIDPSYEEEIRYHVENEYLAAFPGLAEKYSFHVCGMGDGIEL